MATDLNLADDFLWVRCWNAEIHTRADQHIAKLKSEDCFVDHLEWLATCQQTSFMCYCRWWTFWTVCSNTEWVLTFANKTVELLTKAVQNLIHNWWIFNVPLHIHFKNWTLKLKWLYLLNHISCFNEILEDMLGKLSCIKSDSFAQIRSTVAEIQNFFYGFFIGAPCILFWVQWCMFAFRFRSSVLSQEIGWEERVRSDLSGGT